MKKRKVTEVDEDLGIIDEILAKANILNDKRSVDEVKKSFSNCIGCHCKELCNRYKKCKLKSEGE